jgi:hypothetical protein
MRAHCFSTDSGDLWVAAPEGKPLHIDATTCEGAYAVLTDCQVRELREACDTYLRERAKPEGDEE